MKMLNYALYLLLAIILVVNARCSKENPGGGGQVILPPAGTNNRPPVSKAGPDQIVLLPTTIALLDGSMSSDPDNNISTYSWTRIAGSSSCSISNPVSVQTQVSNLTVGIYQFELMVTDLAGLSVKDTIAIEVKPALQGAQSPVANAGPDQIIRMPLNSVALNGSGSHDPDNNIISYQWTKIAGPIFYAISQPTTMQTQVSNLTLGIYQFELLVTDATGLWAKDTIVVEVLPVLPVDHHAPVASAGLDQTITLPLSSVVLDGSGSYDPDNNISIYEWRKIQGPAAGTIINANDVQTQATGLVSGTYKFELKVTDTGGLSDADTMQVIVNPPGPYQEIIFNDLTWIFPWYNAVEVPNFYSHVPQGVLFRIFIQRDNNPTWIEVPSLLQGGNQGQYEYFIETRPGGGGIYSFGSLYIFYYGNDVSDTPNVKITF